MRSEFDEQLDKAGEYGVVYQVSHPIVFIEGLPNVKSHEVIVFETGEKAEVFAINRGKIEARTFSADPIKVGTMVTRTGQLLSVPVGEEILGHVLNPLGEPLDTSSKYVKPQVTRDIDSKPLGISDRQKITNQLITGVSLVDLMIPLGRGQRELIIGDRKTGKTSLIMTTIKNQVYEGNTIIYAAIAKKKSDIKKLQVFFEKEKIMDKVVIVATSSYDSPTMIFQTPYAAMSIAEYFRDQGTHCLIVLDDLSTHAKFYREISLLARRFPGRDSYPGDIFYVHSRLLERAGNFKHKTKGEVSITCLPVIEIVEGDFTGYIATNVMGITDGHIYLDSNIYYQGMRPAVNVPLSVTRVGRQTLSKLSREVNKELTSFLTENAKLQQVSHFGQELTDDVKKNLRIGDLINAFFSQPYQETVPYKVQLIIVAMILQDLFSDKSDIIKVKKALVSCYYDRGKQKFIHDLTNFKEMKELFDAVLKERNQILGMGGIAPMPQSAPAPASSQPVQQPVQQPVAPPVNQQPS